MAWPKGVPRGKKPVKMKKDPIEGVEITPLNAIDSGLISEEISDDRYDRFEQFRVENPEVDNLEEGVDNPEEQVEQPVTAETELPPEEEVEAPPEPENQEEPEVPAEQEQKKVEEKPPQTEVETEKTVPLAALKEARHEIRELKKQLNAKLEERKEETIHDDDDYVTRKDIKTLQEKIDSYEREKSKLEMDVAINNVDASLKQEGISGFKEILLPLVQQELNAMYYQDPDLAIAHDNPEGWKKIAREQWPKIKALFIQSDANRVMSEREQKKKSAGMVASPGIKTPSDKKEQERMPTREEAFAEFIQERRAGLL